MTGLCPMTVLLEGPGCGCLRSSEDHRTSPASQGPQMRPRKMPLTSPATKIGLGKDLEVQAGTRITRPTPPISWSIRWRLRQSSTRWSLSDHIEALSKVPRCCQCRVSPQSGSSGRKRPDQVNEAPTGLYSRLISIDSIRRTSRHAAMPSLALNKTQSRFATSDQPCGFSSGPGPRHDDSPTRGTESSKSSIPTTAERSTNCIHHRCHRTILIRDRGPQRT